MIKAYKMQDAMYQKFSKPVFEPHSANFTLFVRGLN